ncbi:MAG: M20/M25/M40 family metallo-hydrolase, partial [Brevundimonas sp.]
MSRLALLAGALFAGLTLAVLALQVPAARPVDAPPTVFAAGRAMVDIRRIADEPHPVGTPAHAEVRAWLFGRMTELDLAPEVQVGVLSPEASQRLERWSDGAIAGYSRIFNLVGVMPGRDRNAPAVLLMAHYDTSWNSPGAADDSAGVDAILEAVRELQAEGPFERDLVVLLTDAEELNLDGARAFFSEHPLRDRIGLVITLEARGGGGRAMMFETGPGNAETVALFARAAGQVEGGVTGNALATLVYENMPNGTDYTIPKARGIAGLNIAFIGRPDQYHSPASTPEALDPGALQHLGDQALTLARLALTAEALPQATRNVVFADLLGRGYSRLARSRRISCRV